MLGEDEEEISHVYVFFSYFRRKGTPSPNATPKK